MTELDLEARLIDLARQRGLLSVDESELHGDLLSSDGTRDFGPRISALLEAGLLKHADMQALLAELLQTPTTTPLGEVAEGLVLPKGPSWQGYKDLTLIGAGGNALIYRAWDPQLDRWVALKCPVQASPHHLANLLREASAQAKVDHPHVIKVFEVGEHQDHPYIALQLVEGGTLGKTWRQFSVETRILILKGVAEGLQVAHEQGLLHLDIKPSNILMDTSDPGRPWPYLTDFGLARHRLHRHGRSGLGTPAFASPEQLAGDSLHLDARSDVYSLGATLYYILAGEPPFAISDTAERLNARPIPLGVRDPLLPKDLQAITDKCLRPNPADRYPTAKAVAEDLQRFLAGVPVHAHQLTPTYRLGKWVRRNRGVAVLLITAVTLLAGLGLWRQRSVRRQAFELRLAERYGNDVEGVERLLRLEHLSRQHDRRPAIAKARATMTRIQRDMNALGRDAFGPGSYALGAGHALLGEWEEARRHLDAAWSARFRTPVCAQARGEVLTKLFNQGKAAIRKDDANERQNELHKLELALRDPALECFRVARQGGLNTPYQEAMEAYLKDDFTLALARAEASTRQTPWLYQADLLRCTILNELGKVALGKGDSETATQHFLARSKIIGQVLEVAPSDPENWIFQANTCFNLSIALHQDMSWIKRACDLCETAIVVDPDLHTGYELLSRALCILARDVDSHGQDPLPLFNRSVAYAEQSMARTPPGIRNTALGQALFFRADNPDRSLDPKTDLDRAIGGLKDQCSRLGADYLSCFYLKLALLGRADVAYAKGEDPLPFSREAVRWAQEEFKFNPSSLRAELSVIDIKQGLAQFERSLGVPFSEPPANLILQLESIGHRRPPHLPPNVGDLKFLGDFHLYEAEHKRRSGIDPWPDFEAGLQAYRTALRLNPKGPLVVFRAHARGALYVGAYLRSQRKDPQPVLEAGLQDVRRACELNPDDLDARSLRWVVSLFLARYRNQLREAAGFEQKVRTEMDRRPYHARKVQDLLDLWAPGQPPAAGAASNPQGQGARTSPASTGAGSTGR